MTTDGDPVGSEIERAAIPGLVSAQNLDPIPGDLPLKVRSFVETIRGLFGALDVSLTRFSVQMYCDKGTLSRYLNGSRIPPQDFVDKLLKAFFDRKGTPVTAEVQRLVYEQYLAAVQARNPARYQLLDLTSQLRQAIQEKQQCEIQIMALEEAVESRQNRIYELEMEMRAIQGGCTTELRHDDSDIKEDQEHTRHLEQIIGRLYGEVTQLREQLEQAQARAVAAEQRCQLLEERLDAASSATEEQEGPAAESMGDRNPEARAKIALLTSREREMLQLLARGRTNREIALDLHLAGATVSDRISTIYSKLQIETHTANPRVMAALFARDAGL